MRKWLILLALVLLSVVVPIVPALAQDEWTCTYDFTIDEQGWESYPGGGGDDGANYVDDFGWGAALVLTGRAHVVIVFDAPADITTIELTRDEVLTGDVAEISVAQWDGATISDTQTVVQDTLSELFTVNDTWTGIIVQQAQSTTSGSPAINGYLTGAVIEGEGDSPCDELAFVKPLKSTDLDNEWSTIETYAAGVVNTQKTMLMYSDASGVKVHSAASGTITNIHKMQVGDCYSYFASPIVLATLIGCSISIHGYVFWLPGTFVTTPVQVVTLETDGGYRLVYFVKNADDYITEGQHVEADCWLGETFKLDTIELSVGIGPFGASADNTPGSGGVTMWSLQEGAVPIDGPDLFTIEPNGNSPCNQPEGYQDCMGDAPLNIASQWTVGGATWEEPGVTLQPNGFVSTTMNLLETLNPQMKVSARAIGGSGSFRMQLGQTVETATATPVETEYEIAAAEHESDLAGLYTVKVTNTSTVAIHLTYICVQNTTDEGGDPDPPEEPPNSDNVCIFENNSFTDGTTGWGVTATDSGPGELRVADTGTFSQTVTVPADTYTLTVVASIWSYNAFTADDTDTTDVVIEWDFPADTTYDGSGSKTFGQFAENNNLVVYQIEVVVGSDTTGAFTMRVSLDSVPSNVRGVAIRSVCLGDESSGGDDGGGQPGEDGPFEVSCFTSSAPTGNGVGAWTGWLWGKFRSFFTCELMPLLNSMYRLMQDSYRLFGWSVRYSQATMVQGMTWVGGQLIPWLGGHLSNIAVGQVTTINSADECGNLFCLIKGIFDSTTSVFNGILDIMQQLVDPDSPFWDVLRGIFDDLFDFLDQSSSDLFDLLELLVNRIYDLLSQILNLFGSVIGLLGTIIVTIVGFVLQLLAKALEIFNIILQLMATIVNAWMNSAPIDPGGLLTSCELDQTTARCMIFYISERTVFTEQGQFFMPVLAGAIYLALIVWVIRRLRQAVMDLGVLS